jgi:hypothetical protein
MDVTSQSFDQNLKNHTNFFVKRLLENLQEQKIAQLNRKNLRILKFGSAEQIEKLKSTGVALPSTKPSLHQKLASFITDQKKLRS